MPDNPPERQNPILIIAPLPRCGSTLLQRLINSTRQAIIYGENFFLLDRVPDGLADLHRHGAWKSQHSKAVMDRFMAGEDLDGTALYPDHPAFLAAARDSFYSMIRYYERTSARFGFARWGIKHQMRGLPGLEFLMRLLPRSRCIFIYRDILPVARSMKGRWPDEYSGEREMQRLAIAWREGVERILTLQGDNILVLRYETFTADPAPGIAGLETFIGIKGIDPAVMNRKINANARVPDPNVSRGVYVPPADLTPEETSVLVTGCADLRQRLGYTAATQEAKGKRAAPLQGTGAGLRP